VLDRQQFNVPAYQSSKGIELYASRDEYEAATRDLRFRLEKLAYRSANLRVFAYLYSPVQPSGKRPAVIFNRGSFVRDEFASELLTTFHRLGEAGFVVLAPMYRQSGGGEGRDEMGGADLTDLMATDIFLRHVHGWVFTKANPELVRKWKDERDTRDGA